MGQLRSGLRAYAMDRSSPSEVVERLSQLLRQLEPGRNATLLYLLLDPQEGSLVLAGAGHPTAARVGRRRWMRLCRDAGIRAAGRCALRALRGCRGAARAGGVARALHRRRGRAPRRLAGRGTRAAQGSGLPHGLRAAWRCATRSSGPAPEGATHDDAALLVGRALPLVRSARAAPPADVDTIPSLRRVLGRWLREADASRARSRRSPSPARRPAPTRSSMHMRRDRPRWRSRPRSRGPARPSSACATSEAGARRGVLTGAGGWS